MELKEQKYITAIAEHGNLTRAAKSLNISQPALSLFLKRFERELGISLFELKNMTYIPTKAGEAYIKTSLEMLNLDINLKRELNLIRKNSNNLVFGTTTNVGDYIVKYLFNMMKENPYINTISVTEGSNEYLTEKLLTGDADFVLLYEPPGKEIIHTDVQKTFLRYDALCCSLPKKELSNQHIKSSRESKLEWIDLTRADNLIFLAPNNKPFCDMMELVKQDLSLTQDIIHLGSTHTQQFLCQEGYFLRFHVLPGESLASKYDQLVDSAADFKMLLLGHKFYLFKFSLCWHKNRMLTKQEEYMIDNIVYISQESNLNSIHNDEFPF